MPSTPVWKRLALHTRSTSDFLPKGQAHLLDGHYDLFALSLNTPRQDEWRLHEPPKEEPGGQEEHERELTQLFPEVWAEDTPPPQPGWLNRGLGWHTTPHQ